jgi:hypothetical protein
MSRPSFEFYNNLGRFNFKITTQKSGRWNKPVIVITRARINKHKKTQNKRLNKHKNFRK